MTTPEADSTDIKPLTRRTRAGEIYVRRPDAELQIEKVLTLEKPQVTAMFAGGEKRRDEADYLLDETIVYLLRETLTAAGDDELRDVLYEELNRRIWKLLLKFRRSFINQADFEDFGQQTGLAILRKIFDTRTDAGDFAQVQFGSFVITEAKGVWKGSIVKSNRERDLYEKPREDDENDNTLENLSLTDELSAESRLIINEGLRNLPPEHQTVAALLLDGFQIESKDEDAPTISKMLGVSSRTIRNWMVEMRRSLAGLPGEMRR